MNGKKRGFSLIEILVVLGIISILTGVFVASMGGQKSHEFKSRLEEISGTIELCHTHAMTNRSTVRILFSNDPTHLILLPLVSSQDGSPSEEPRSEMENPKSWTMIGKALDLRNVHLNNEFLPASEELSNFEEFSGQALQRKVGGTLVSFDRYIQFSPSGEVTMNDSNTQIRKVQFGIESIGAKPNRAALQISGLTGRVEILSQESLNHPRP